MKALRRSFTRDRSGSALQLLRPGIWLLVAGLSRLCDVCCYGRLALVSVLVESQDRSFEIAYPYFAACGALRVPDVASLFLEGDPLGLRGRVSFFYSRPAFNKAAEVRQANDALHSSGQLSEEVATFFWPCHTTHDPLWAGLERFAQVKGYPFRVYELSDAARAAFDQAFDFHVDKQKENHLVDQELAKFHGKAKTKHVRLALALHLYEQTRQRKTSENWSMVVEQKHLVVALKLGEYLDSVSAAMARFYASVMAEPIPSGAPGPAGKQSARQQLAAVLDGDWSFFAQIPDDMKVLFWRLSHEILRLESVWIENVALTRLATVNSCKYRSTPPTPMLIDVPPARADPPPRHASCPAGLGAWVAWVAPGFGQVVEWLVCIRIYLSLRIE